MILSWKTTKTDAQKILKLAQRASKMAGPLSVKYPIMEADMDLTACHLNGCELNLDGLIAADDFNFSHDLFGIRRHINRSTGKLEGCFLPRFAA